MAKVHGKDGSVTFASGYTDHVFAWSLDRAQELAEATILGSVNRIKVAGLKAATGTYSCYVDDTTALHDAGDVGTATFTMDTLRTFTCEIIISGVTVSVGLDGLQTAVYKWELSGTGVAGDFVVA